jgi:hypothetical protein
VKLQYPQRCAQNGTWIYAALGADFVGNSCVKALGKLIKLFYRRRAILARNIRQPHSEFRIPTSELPSGG